MSPSDANAVTFPNVFLPMKQGHMIEKMLKYAYIKTGLRDILFMNNSASIY